MGRIAIVLFIFLFTANPSWSQDVSPDLASQVALNFFKEKKEMSSASKFLSLPDPVLNETRYKGVPVYYFIEFPGEGFVIVSASELCVPICAYSLESNDGNTSMSPSTEAWLDWYARQVYQVKNEGLKGGLTLEQQWSHYKSDPFVSSRISKQEGIGPLTSSQWGQKYYYNTLCPADPAGPGGHAIAGCVATAMAQLMFYYRYPYQGEGVNEYMSDYGIEYADFENAEYRWDEMVNNIYGIGNPEIAELIYHAGVSVNMDYHAQSSGALTIEGVEALKTHFRYDTGMSYISIYDTNLNFRDSLIHNLQQHRIMLYRGGDLGGGHAFLCDGYEDSTFFHFNWGWNGNYDGYYTIEDLNPNVYNLSFDQQAAINVYPRENYPTYCQDPQTLSAGRGTFTDGSGPDHYLPETTCSWLISPDNEELENVMLWFTHLETTAGEDVLRIYDGISNSDPLIGQFSGDDLPPMIISTGPQLLIEFQTGSQGTAQGWNAEYLGYAGPHCDDWAQYNQFNMNFFTDGSGPYPYINNSDCYWHIKPQGDVDSVGTISLFFHWLDLNEGDTLYLFNGSDNTSPLLMKLYGDQLPDTLESEHNELLLNFISDNDMAGDGWAAGYRANRPVYCADTVVYTEKTAILEDGSENYKYVPFSECYWLIETENTELITFEFLEFDLEYGYDQLRFYDASSAQPSLFATYWGHDVPELLEMFTNKVLIKFSTDESAEFQGWKIKYTALAPGIGEVGINDAIVLVPNPAMGEVNITGLRDAQTIRLFDVNMRMLRKVELTDKNNNDNKLDLYGLNQGLYFIIVEKNNRQVIRKLIVY